MFKSSALVLIRGHNWKHKIDYTLKSERYHSF